MDQNLIASIFNSQEQIRLCLETPIPLDLGVDGSGSLSDQKRDSITSDQGQGAPVVTSSSSQPRPSVKRVVSPIGYDDSLDDSYVVQVSGVVAKKSQSSLVKQQYIEYQLSVSRLADGVTQQIFKRFREIKSFYHEVSSGERKIIYYHLPHS
jgi:hypothetical protein